MKECKWIDNIILIPPAVTVPGDGYWTTESKEPVPPKECKSGIDLCCERRSVRTASMGAFVCDGGILHTVLPADGEPSERSPWEQAAQGRRT